MWYNYEIILNIVKSMAQYPIPQFIESEGKIISFLTFRQFFWLVGGGAVCLGLYYVLPYILFVILGFIIAVSVVMVAFVKINDMPITTLLLNYFSFSTKSKNYVWKKKQSAYPFATKKPPELTKVDGEPSKLQNAKQMIEYRKKI